jgi:hypothetical protein
MYKWSPNDEYVMFERCGGKEELNKNINLKSVHFLLNIN